MSDSTTPTAAEPVAATSTPATAAVATEPTPAPAPAPAPTADPTAATSTSAATATATATASESESTPVAVTAPEENKTETKAEEKKKEEKMEEKKEEKKAEPMFGIFHSVYGKPRDVLQLSHELSKPIIRSSKQVLIRVHAASINPVDYKLLGGDAAAVMKRKFPYVPGFDVAGVVVAVGTGCRRIKVGDEVFGDLAPAGGSMAEYCVADENHVVLKPTNLTFGEAACVPLASLTSYQALIKHGGLRSGDGKKILILNGSGGTGSYGIQIGKAYGAHVSVTCSARNAAFCAHLGADKIIDYTKSEWHQVLPAHSIDIIYDCVGTPNSWQNAKQVLKKGGIFVTIAGDSPGGKITVGTALGTAATIIGRKFASLVTKFRYHWFLASVNPEDLSTIKTMCESKQIRPIIEKYYTIQGKEKADEKESGIELFEHLMSGRTRGKLALEVHQPGERHEFEFDKLPEYVWPVEEEKKEETKEEVKEEAKEKVSATNDDAAAATPATTDKPADATPAAGAAATSTPATDAKPAEETKAAEATPVTETPAA